MHTKYAPHLILSIFPSVFYCSWKKCCSQIKRHSCISVVVLNQSFMVQFLEKVKDKFHKLLWYYIIIIWYPNHRHGKLWFSLFSSLRTSLRNYVSENTGTNTAHDQISLISALSHLKCSFDMYELNAICYFYIWYSR